MCIHLYFKSNTMFLCIVLSFSEVSCIFLGEVYREKEMPPMIPQNIDHRTSTEEERRQGLSQTKGEFFKRDPLKNRKIPYSQARGDKNRRSNVSIT